MPMKISLLKRHEVQVLLRAGHRQKEVAAVAGLSTRTVQRIASEPLVTEFVEPARPRRGRPSKVEGIRDRITDWLQAEPFLAASEILARARAEGYREQKTALYSLVSALRTPDTVESLPAAFSEHDYGAARLRFFGGVDKRVYFFVTRLRFSRWMLASLVPDLKIETLARCMLAHFATLGGVPLVSVFLHPKASQWLTAPNSFQWCTSMADMALRLGFGLELEPAARWGVRKSRPANTVRRELALLQPFRDFFDMEAKLSDGVLETNRSVSRVTGDVPADLFEKEQRSLRPMSATPEKLPFRFSVCVREDASAWFEGKTLPMPSDASNRAAVVNLYADRLEIVADPFAIWHPWPQDANTKID